MENTDIIFRNNQEKEQVSVITDPFKKKCLKTIAMFAQMDTYDGTARITGSVDFKNGDTEGTQKFRASSLGELLIKIHAFCMNLKEK